MENRESKLQALEAAEENVRYWQAEVRRLNYELGKVQNEPHVDAITKIGVKKFAEKVCEKYGITYEQFRHKSRVRPLVDIRTLVAVVAVRHCRYTLSQVGAVCGGRDHTTILNYLERHDNFYPRDWDYTSLYKQFEKWVKETFV